MWGQWANPPPQASGHCFILVVFAQWYWPSCWTWIVTSQWPPYIVPGFQTPVPLISFCVFGLVGLWFCVVWTTGPVIIVIVGKTIIGCWLQLPFPLLPLLLNIGLLLVNYSVIVLTSDRPLYSPDGLLPDFVVLIPISALNICLTYPSPATDPSVFIYSGFACGTHYCPSPIHCYSPLLTGRPDRRCCSLIIVGGRIIYLLPHSPTPTFDCYWWFDCPFVVG